MKRRFLAILAVVVMMLTLTAPTDLPVLAQEQVPMRTINLTSTRPPIISPAVAVDDTYSVYMSNPLSIPAPAVLNNDHGNGNGFGDIEWVSGPSNGTLVWGHTGGRTDGSFVYTPNPGYAGVDSFKYVLEYVNDLASPKFVYSNFATVTINITFPSCVIPPSGMIAWWPLDETSGTTVADISNGGIGGSDGKAVNDSGVITAIGDPCGLISIPNQYVDNSLDFVVPYNISPYVSIDNTGKFNFGKTGDFSIDAWVRLGSPSDEVPIVSGWTPFLRLITHADPESGFVFYMIGGNLALQVGTVTFGGGTYLTTAGWHHVAVTVDRGTGIGSFYFDGSPTAPNLTLLSVLPLMLRLIRLISGGRCGSVGIQENSLA